MDEYIKLLLEQVRCKKAHQSIREELQGHIEDQIEHNIANGMSSEEAEVMAIKDMGNPMEVGVSLDRIHKPQVAWEMIFLMAFITVAGTLIHLAIGTPNFIGYQIMGFILMLIVYRMDYTFFARFSKIFAIVFLCLCESAIHFGYSINGALHYLRIGRINIQMFSLMLLYVPLYGAVIYKYHGEAYKGLLKAIIWMILPVFIAFRIPSLPLVAMLLVSMSTVLTIAIIKDWFAISKKKTIAALWSVLIGVPVVSLCIGFPFLATYQAERIKAFLTNSGDANYVTAQLKSLLGSSNFIGQSTQDIASKLPDYNNSFILTYLSAGYGISVGLLVCGVLAFFIIKAFLISFRQKNQIGMIMGAGSATILLINIVINVMENIGLLPVTQTFLPFFSAGGSCTMICYILTGIIMSVYRYKNIYPAHVSTKLPKFKITIDL